MKHRASARFWALYGALPEEVRSLADKNYVLLKPESEEDHRLIAVCDWETETRANAGTLI